MIRTLHQCPACGAWTPEAWSGPGGVCTACYLTTMALLERFPRGVEPWRDRLRRIVEFGGTPREALCIWVLWGGILGMFAWMVCRWL